MKLLCFLFCFLFCINLNYTQAIPAAINASVSNTNWKLNSINTVFQNKTDSCDNFWFLSFVGSRIIKALPKSKKPIIIAVIDDGFRLTHRDIAAFLYHNTNEKINSLDDDANGYKDDYTGWDISDNDANVTPPRDKLKEYYHGTYLCGLISNVLKSCYGDKASDYFKIVPIKAIADRADRTYIKDGYKAIAYAIAVHADIICCAWGSNVITAEEKELLKKASDAGIIILSSAGNFNNSLEHYPAAAEDIIAVGAVDSLNKKAAISNFGRFLDLSAPGANICGASSLNDSGIIYKNGTSPAVAIATAAAAIIKINLPKKKPIEIEETLKGTAIEIDSLNPTYIGRLGAGVLSIKNIIDFIESGKEVKSLYNKGKQEGFISFFNTKKELKEWEINPYGANLGIELNLEYLTGEPKNGTFKFITKNNTPIQIKLSEWQKQKKIFIDDKNIVVQFIPANASKKIFGRISYEVIPIDSTILYCKGKNYYSELNDSITDGSGTLTYAGNCDCKWQINVPEGYRISFDFLEFDTEAKTDQVYLFDGEYTIPDYAIARFSGPDIPPAVISRTNKVLIWFITDNKINGKGWKLNYKAVK